MKSKTLLQTILFLAWASAPSYSIAHKVEAVPTMDEDVLAFSRCDAKQLDAVWTIHDREDGKSGKGVPPHPNYHGTVEIKHLSGNQYSVTLDNFDGETKKAWEGICIAGELAIMGNVHMGKNNCIHRSQIRIISDVSNYEKDECAADEAECVKDFPKDAKGDLRRQVEVFLYQHEDLKCKHRGWKHRHSQPNPGHSHGYD